MSEHESRRQFLKQTAAFGAIAAVGDLPSAVTLSTLPPLVRICLPSDFVPLWKTFTLGIALALSMPLIGRPVGYFPG